MAERQWTLGAVFASIVLLVSILAWAAGFTRDQVVSVAALAVFIAGSLLFWPFRNAFAFAGLSLLLFAGVIDLKFLVAHSNLEVILFIIGMMIVVGFLEERGFFDWLTARVLGPYITRPRILVSLILALGFVMAALVDEVTAILFMLAMVLRVSRFYRVDPVPLTLFLVFAVNRGSSATVVGNPIGVLIAFRAGFGFTEFLRWAAPPALLSLAVTIGIGLIYMRGTLKEMSKKVLFDGGEYELLKSAQFTDRLVAPTALFLGVITALVLHHQIESALGLPQNAALLAVALAGAGIALFLEHEKAVEIVEKKVDWWTLLYFILLFSSIGTLQYTGVTERIANAVVSASGGDLIKVMILVGLIAGILTAFLDNVLAIATLIPVVESLAAHVNVFPVWWVMLVAGTYWGSATVIGSTANIVAAGYLEKLRKYGEKISDISMARWMSIGFPVAILTFLLGFAVLAAQLGLMPEWVPPEAP